MVDIETLEPASAAVLDEFARVSERLMLEFDLDVDIQTGPIADYFDGRSLYRHPTIIIPFTPEAHKVARAITTDTNYPLPQIYDKFAPDTDFTDILAAGLPFSTPTYKLNVIRDVSDQATERYGEDYAKRILGTDVAHEQAHSVFHADPITFTRQDERGLEVYSYLPLAGHACLEYSDYGEVGNMPQWIEEAFAAYVSADVFKDTLPVGHGSVRNFSYYGEGEYYLPERYLARPSKFPGYVGDISGSIAGATLEMLEARMPGTIAGMFGIARGEVDPTEYRNELAERVGSKLFGLMFEQHPYNTWTTIYRCVAEL